MSGGTFDHFQYKIDDAVDKIENIINKNHTTILENWNKISKEEQFELCEYERPWSLSDHPYFIDEIATKTADKELNIRHVGAWKPADGVLFKDLSDEERERWNTIRKGVIQKYVDEHNNSFIGYDFSDKVIDKFKEMVPIIKKAKIYLDRIDWLLAGDDGEDSFLKRTVEDLEKANLNEK